MKKFLLILSPFAVAIIIIYAFTNTGRAGNTLNHSYEHYYNEVDVEEDSTIDSNLSEEVPISEKHYEHSEPDKQPNSSNSSSIDLNPDSITVLVNKNYMLTQTYEPSDLVIPDIKFAFSYYDPKMQLREVAASAMEQLFQAALNDGITLAGISGYRSYDRQFEIYASNLIRRGIDFTNLYSAMPGASEHQTGLAMDVSAKSVGYRLTDQFATTKEGQWLAEHCYEYGYIIRFPANKTEITGYAYEPWHIRYVGIELATYLTENNLTLDEYYGYHYDKELESQIDYDAFIDEYYERKHIRRPSTHVSSAPNVDADITTDLEGVEDILIDGDEIDLNSSEEELDTKNDQDSSNSTEVDHTTTPKPTKDPESTKAPKPTKVPKPTKGSKPTEVPEPTKTPEPTEVPEPTKTPEPTEVSEPTKTPEPTEVSEPTGTATPSPTAIPDDTKPTSYPDNQNQPSPDISISPEEETTDATLPKEDPSL